MNLKIVQWNIKSLIKNKSSLSLICSDTKPQIICLQETWSHKHSNLNIPGYYLISHTHRNTLKGGGVAILASTTFPITNIPITSSLEACAARIHSSHQSFTIISLYLPPVLNNATLSNELNSLLNSLPPPYLICTDSNGHHPSWGSENSNNRGKILNEWTNSNNLIILNTGSPTFETPRGSFTHIDLTISSQLLSLDLDWEVYHDNITSDHFPIIIKSNHHHVHVPTHSPRYKLQKADWLKFQTKLELPLPPFNDPTSVCNSLENSIISAAKSSIPLTKSGHRYKIEKYWWNSNCSEALKLKKNAFKHYKKNLGDESAWIEYRKKKAFLTMTLQKAKKEAWEKFTQSLNEESTSKEVWDKIRLLRNKKTNKNIILKSSSSFIHCPYQVGEILAQEFSTRGININIQNNPSFFTYDNSSKYNNNFTIHELKRALRMGSSNTPGPDNIPPEIYRHFNSSSQNQLLNIINYFWNTGLPSQWKNSIIIPIHKPNKPPTNPASYRPISLTNSICKIMERLVNIRLKQYLFDHQILDQNQSGFRPGYSTLDAISRLENRIRINQVLNKITLTIFIDISQAFDSINHNALLHKLHALGINGNLGCFIRNFLSNRFISVKNQGISSSLHHTPLGVPQGAVISPSLFNIYINDLLKNLNIQNLDYSKFADDLALWISDLDANECINKGQRILNYIEDWTKAWGLTLSATKTKAIFFTRRKIPQIPLKINDTNIEILNKYKFLGLTLDRNLTYKAHIQDLRLRCQKDINLLKIVGSQKWGADFITLRKLYTSLIQSKIVYGIFIYGTACKTYIKQLISTMSTAQRIILGAMICTRSDHLNLLTNLLPFNLLHDLYLTKYTSKIMSNKENPFRKNLIDYTPIYSYRCLRFPSPLCGRIQNLFTKLPINYKNIALFPFNYTNYSPRPFSFETIHQFQKANLNQENWIKLYKFLILKYPNYHHMFTDGSVVEEKSGCGVFSSLFSLKTRLPNKTSILSCELFAIYIAILGISKNPGRYLILSDSLSSIRALKSPYESKNYLVLKIAALVSQLRTSEIIIEWIPSHMGIPGNDAADHLAKESLKSQIINIPYYNYTEAMKILENHIKNQFKTCSPCLHSNKISYQNTGIEAAHFHLPRHLQVKVSRLHLRVTKITHLHILTKSNPNTCCHCNTILTLHHIFIQCPFLAIPRAPLLNYCFTKNINYSLDTILNGLFPSKLLLEFLRTSDLLDKI